MKRIMLDIETMGTKPGSAIIQIGACCDGSRFQATVNLTDCLLHGMTVDLETIEWWQEQSDAAKHSVRGAPAPLDVALQRFIEWWDSVGDRDNTEVWSQGPHFDIILLEHAFRLRGFTPPWKYNMVRDLRTLTRTLESFGWNAPSRSPEYIPHNALDDAVYQMGVLHAALACITSAEYPESKG